MKTLALSVLFALCAFAQNPGDASLASPDGPTVNPTKGPPTAPFTQKMTNDGNGNPQYLCIARSYGPRTAFVVTNVTTASPAVVTVTGSHGMLTGALGTLVGAGNVPDGIYSITSTGASTFTLNDRVTGAAINGSGSFTAGATFTSNAPRTNQPQWAIQHFIYTGTTYNGQDWIEGSTRMVYACDNASSYGHQ